MRSLLQSDQCLLHSVHVAERLVWSAGWSLQVVAVTVWCITVCSLDARVGVALAVWIFNTVAVV